MRSLSIAIGASGALLEVEIGPGRARAQALMRQGLPVPNPILVPFLVDTGASMSMVDDGLMRSLGLAPTSATGYHSASTAGVPQACDVYDVALVLGRTGTPRSLRIDPLPIMGTPLLNQPFDGLLGRDVLNRLELAWNGPGARLTLAYP